MSHSSSEEGSAENPEQHEEAKDKEDEQPAEEEQEQKGEEEAKPETVTIHIGNLKWEAQENDLRDLFNEFGEIKSVRIPQDDRGRSKGYGFVEFATKEAADAAIAKMDQNDFMGRPINVTIANNPGQRNYDNRDRRGGDRRGGDRRGGDRRGGGRRYNDRGGDRRRDHGDRRDRDRDDRGDRDRGDRYGRGSQY